MDITLYSTSPVTARFRTRSTRAVLTALLVRRLDVVAVTDQGSDCSTHSVSVRLLGFLVQEVIRHQTRVAFVYDVLNIIIISMTIRTEVNKFITALS